MPEDNWIHRSEHMRCRTCIAFVEKKAKNPTPKTIGRCRMKSPTMKGFPVVFDDDWCMEHKLDENAWAANQAAIADQYFQNSVKRSHAQAAKNNSL